MGADHYRTLNVAADAEAEVVRAAYLALMRKHHPDVVGDDPAARLRAQEISVAFGVLGDPEKRARYDRDRQDRPQAPPVSPARPVAASSPRRAAPARRRPSPERGSTLDARRRRLKRARWASVGLFALAVGLVAAGAAGIWTQLG